MESRAQVRKHPLKGQSLRAVWALGVFLLALFAEPLHHVTVRHHAGTDGELLHCETHCHAAGASEQQQPGDPLWSPEEEGSKHESCGLKFEARVDRAPHVGPLRIARPADSAPALQPRREPRELGPDLFLIAPKNSPPRRTV